ncbi:hypothetical protein OKA05_05955 [Luteolibacter arcticus]|uniref:Secreted protein n=1 Tax=Luteolibacter arcticus TaxID=1581411 RepID=A0ABT3GEP0_9BACT|nr:hypothetical protein [Luteolibacter arcticus]MCW1922088.1 hypothetical protein [Luteolibacter arcticus]
MKRIWLVGILALLSVACQREEEASSGASSKKKPGQSGGGTSEMPPGTRSAKATNRGESKKPIPTAEAVPDQPGFVKSPYNGEIVDVTGVPAGTVVDDPGYPAEEEKQFRVPKMAEAGEDEILPPPDIEAAKAEARTAKVVPGKPGFIVCPWDQSEFDASGFEAGAVIMDPSSTPETPRFLTVPDDHIQPE